METLDAGGAARLTIELEVDAHATVLVLAGELDLETATELDRQLARIEESPATRVVIDLRGVTFMDSTGLSSIVRAHRAAESDGHTLQLRPGARQVQRLFELTGMNERLTFVEE
jgi:anti-sigma B factor antagonist